MSRYGYTSESGVEIPAMIDMINGGGPGRSGDRFEGGGILSALANILARPYGSVRARPGHGAPGEPGISTAEDPYIDEPPVADPEDLMVPPVDSGPITPTGGVDDTYTGGRVLQWDDLGMVRRLAPPAIQALFTSDMLGEEITDPQLVMILNALEASASIGRQGAPIRPSGPSALPRVMTEEDFENLMRNGEYNPELLEQFRGISPGAPLTASEALLLDRLP